ncbi:hypothetical protein HDV00_010955 [Rhizophlyctis rosea]|nr:hypothetical protein HDV00_010955 [Rhizophlyctis rosea]
MDACQKQFQDVYDRQAATSTATLAVIDDIISSLETTRAALTAQPQPDPSQTAWNLTQIAAKAKASNNKLANNHKDLTSSLSKYSKAVEKKFKTDLDSVWDPGALDGKDAVLDTALTYHLIREGAFEVAQQFASEAGVNIPSEMLAGFEEMYTILSAMDSGDLDPAVLWAAQRRKELADRGSSLEFELRKLVFVRLLQNDRPQEALAYARSCFDQFRSQHLKEIQRLMGSLLYATRLSTSPYADLLSPTLSHTVTTHFTRDFCYLLGLPATPPLTTSILVGIHAMPTILKMSALMKTQAGLEWSQQNELPVEIQLLDSQRYHSVFACPVSKEQSTENNPPMLMTCGHVICKDCLQRLGKGNVAARFKCPYCPQENSIGSSTKIFI